MLGWLNGLLGLFTGTFSAIWKSVVSLVTSVYQWLEAEVTTLRNDLNSLWSDVSRLADEMASFVDRTYNTFVTWVSKTLDDVVKWAESAIAVVQHYADDILSWASQEFDYILKWVPSLIGDLEQWAIQHIWDPLYNSVSGAVNWIEHEGASIYDLVTHPDRLTQFILAYVWSAWLDLFRQFAKPIVSYILNSLRGNIPDLISVIEDIITSVL
jgi:phage-related protein